MLINYVLCSCCCCCYMFQHRAAVCLLSMSQTKEGLKQLRGTPQQKVGVGQLVLKQLKKLSPTVQSIVADILTVIEEGDSAVSDPVS